MGGSSRPSPTSQTVHSVDLPEYAEPYFQRLMERKETLIINFHKAILVRVIALRVLGPVLIKNQMLLMRGMRLELLIPAIERGQEALSMLLVRVRPNMPRWLMSKIYRDLCLRISKMLLI
jgi:hypothetical protein